MVVMGNSCDSKQQQRGLHALPARSHSSTPFLRGFCSKGAASSAEVTPKRASLNQDLQQMLKF